MDLETVGHAFAGAIFGSIIGVITTLYALKQKVSDWVENVKAKADKTQVDDLEAMVLRRLKRVEDEAITSKACEKCREVAKIETAAMMKIAEADMAALNSRIDMVLALIVDFKRDIKHDMKVFGQRQWYVLRTLNAPMAPGDTGEEDA